MFKLIWWYVRLVWDKYFIYVMLVVVAVGFTLGFIYSVSNATYHDGYTKYSKSCNCKGVE